jgi:DNA-binding helix-turn-helix protein
VFQYWKLKQYIEERGLIQKFVAQKTGIEEVALSNILNGRQRCSLENYVKLCKFFNVSFELFIDTAVDGGKEKQPA